MQEETLSPPKPPEKLDRVVIRFAGDSGDGMQLAGTRFMESSAAFGNDLATFPDYPAEIRAPQGTLAGVSSFQVHIADWDILTHGDEADVLVAMNPAALKANLREVVAGGLILANEDAFDDRNLEKAGYESNPLTDDSLSNYHVMTAPMEKLTKLAVAGTGVKGRSVLRSKNFFALGLISWMFNRPTESVYGWIEEKFGADTPVGQANVEAFRAGFNFGNTTEEFHHTFEVAPAKLPAGTYTNITGNQALAWGLVAAAKSAGLTLFLGSYPITPATSILEEVARLKHFGAKTFQAEDEIAGVGVSLGAAFAGHLAVTTTSGPGVALKSETLSLALMTELPLILVDVQRAGPSTGLPTKVEQSDLMMALYGRHGEAPLPVLAAASPSDAFEVAMEAARIALTYMTPVILLSDGYLANGAEPWRLPDFDDLPSIDITHTTKPNGPDGVFYPYARDEVTGARPWAVPGTPGLEHRIGGLEKAALTGNVSHDPDNHEMMTAARAAKVAGIANDIPEVEVFGPEEAKVLVVSWGSTFGGVRAGVKNATTAGYPAAHVHLRYLNPLPRNLGDVLARYDKVLIPELNLGQLAMVLRAKFLVPAITLSKVQGAPFMANDVTDKIIELLEDKS
ncbi:MAG: 2-oxoacid:acceptor oxidoreductase subunit alpha [bacterium]|nr:2-oxoacid:acceptor oxidoreductase subunit alpha [bacterium]MCP4968360.1 2-oxoacid:acceptor oxidoreductase subunit alpha [bacterium]